MSKATKKRLRRIENNSRFMTLADGLSDAERQYVHDLDTADCACVVEFSEDFRGIWSDEEFATIDTLRASLPPTATSIPPSDAHLSARSKKKIKAVLEQRARGGFEEMAKLEREGAFPVYRPTNARRSKRA